MSLCVCIPTFNREETLKQTLNSVLTQIDFKTDSVVVSDNCSSDGTRKYIKEIIKKFPLITYFRWDKQVEGGLNLLKSIELSQSEFCWLLTDDDVIEPGGIQKVKKILAKYPQISGISVNAKVYDSKLVHLKKVRFVHSLKNSTYFVDPKECLKNLGAWLGFWSAQIVRKSLWESSLDDLTHMKYLGYHHLYLLAKVIKNHSNWYFLSDKCIGYRSDNETFKGEYGIIKRYEIDAVTYQEIYSNLFDRSSFVTKQVCKSVLKYYLFWQIVSLKCEGLGLRNHLKLFKISKREFYDYKLFWFRILPLMFTPNFLLRFMRFVYRKYV